MDTTKPLVKRWPWLLGFLCLSVCEVINFVAVSLAPVSIITPLGSFSVIASAVFGYAFFDEPVTATDVSGISYITFGAMLIIVNGPSTSKDFTVDEFKALVARPTVAAYFASLLVIMVLLGVFARDSFYGILALASIGAGNTITLSKALSTFVKVSIIAENQLANLLPYAIALFMALSLIVQVRCLNAALANHKSYIVNSVHFVMLTAMSVINAAIVYGEMIAITKIGRLMFAAGSISVANGVHLLAVNREEKKAPDDERQPLLQNKSQP
jgi:hypothetical protein